MLLSCRVCCRFFAALFRQRYVFHFAEITATLIDAAFRMPLPADAADFLCRSPAFSPAIDDVLAADMACFAARYFSPPLITLRC